MDIAAVQRFANADLTDEIKALICQYGDHNEVLTFLLRMIWQGRLADALPEAKQYALKPVAGRYVRISAFRAALTVGNAADALEIRTAFVGEAKPLNRKWLAELIEGLPNDQASVDWLLAALEKSEQKQKYSSDGLTEAVSKYALAIQIELLPRLIAGIAKLVAKRPVVQRRHCEISERHGWLLKCAAQAVQRLIEARHPFALSLETI